MKNISKLSDEEILKLLAMPISESLYKRRRQADESAAWLLKYNLRALEDSLITPDLKPKQAIVGQGVNDETRVTNLKKEFLALSLRNMESDVAQTILQLASIPSFDIMSFINEICSEMDKRLIKFYEGIDAIFRLAKSSLSTGLLTSVEAEASAALHHVINEIDLTVFGFPCEKLRIDTWVEGQMLIVKWDAFGFLPSQGWMIGIWQTLESHISGKYSGTIEYATRGGEAFSEEILGFNPAIGKLQLLIFPIPRSENND